MNYDAIVIGSGQAGTPLIFKLANEGLKVALIEKEYLGGTCLNVGCTPTKTYVASARRMWDANHGDELGISIPKGAVANMPTIKQRKDELIKKSVNWLNEAVEKNENIDYHFGEAKFKDNNTVIVNGNELSSDKIFINVGTRTFIPDNFQQVPYLTSTSILELESIPEHLIIIGGSYIGLEFGQMFRRFGSKVSIVEMGETIIAREDREVSDNILKFMKEEGVEFHLNHKCIETKINEAGKVVVKSECENNVKNEIVGSHILIAVGRKSNADLLGLENTQIETDNRGFIKVNDYLETSVKGIYALGDCNGRGAFTHTAYNDYEIVYENMFLNKDRKVTDRISTYCLFVDPPLGRAGMTKAEALSKGYKILEAKRKMNTISRAKEKGEINGFMSVIIDKESNKILGASVLGVGGDEIISSILNIMYAGANYEVLRDSVQPHPTVSELIPTMLESLKEIN